MAISYLLKFVFIFLAYSTMMVADSTKLYCRKRNIPPFPCFGYLATGLEQLFGDCGPALKLFNTTEQEYPFLIQPDCECWKDVAGANILGIPIFNISAIRNALTKANVVLPYKLDGTTDCSTLK
ncbi:hypothetical protein Droror1_Dr00008988 [Drosera rotundifolia]